MDDQRILWDTVVGFAEFSRANADCPLIEQARRSMLAGLSCERCSQVRCRYSLTVRVSAMHFGGMQITACPSAPSDPDSTGPITVQPALSSVLGPAFLPGLARPQLDEDFIDQIVGSNARWKRFLIITRHRELWNSFCGSAVVELRNEYQRLKYRTILTWLQAQVCRWKYSLTSDRSWFVKWPSWSVFLLGLVMCVGTGLMATSIVGVYKLLRNTPGVADSPISCAIIATIAGGCVFGVKCGLASVEGGAWKRRFCLIAAGLTGVLTVAFFVLLSLLTGGLAATTVPVDSIGSDVAVIGRPWLSPHLQYVQLLLEWTASLTVFLFGDVLIDRHGTPDSQPNPIKVYRHRQWRAAEEALRDDKQARGRARGNLVQLLAERKAFVASALASFERKAELARRQEEGLRRQRGEPAIAPPSRFRSLIHRLFNK